MLIAELLCDCRLCLKQHREQQQEFGREMLLTSL